MKTPENAFDDRRTTHASRFLVAIATSETPVTRSFLQSEYNVSATHTTNVILPLIRKDMVRDGAALSRVGSGRPEKELLAGSKLDDLIGAAHDAMTSYDGDADLVDIYEESIAQCAVAHSDAHLEYLRPRAAYLGGVMLLGEHIDLGSLTHGDWLHGTPGIDALVQLRAHTLLQEQKAGSSN